MIFLTADWHEGRRLGNASEPRVGEPARCLRERGWDIRVTPHFSVHPDTGHIWARDWDGNRHEADIVVLQRVMREGLIDTVKRARTNGQIVLSECDDWYEGIPWYNAAWWGSHPKRDSEINRDWYRHTLRASSGVLTSTPYLLGRLKELMPEQTFYLCRNGVDIHRFTQTARHNLLQTASRGTKPVVGWRGGVPWRYGDLLTLRGILGPFMDRHDLEFIHGGFGSLSMDGNERPPIPANHVFGWHADEKVTIRGSTGYERFPEMLKDMDIGVIPLQDNPFNYAKSCLAGMEYAAAGVPFVAYASPEYKWLEQEHGIGRTAKNGQQWKRHLTELLDPEVREAEARRQRDAVEALDIRKMASRWEDAFEHALDTRIQVVA